jgi:hypothetical protein
VTGFRRAIVAALALLVAGCPEVAPPDYGPYRAHMPRSLVVLPPLNETTSVDAPYAYLSTVSRPLAECGYYVLPVAVVDAFMKENGLPTPGEMQAVSLEKLHEVLGADAVLYVTITEWGQKYRVISSDTVVKAEVKLVDVGTGTTLWTGTAFGQQSSSAGQTDPIAILISAVITQVLASFTDPAHDLARRANGAMVFNPRQGLLLGPFHPRADEDVRGRAAE